MNGTRLPLVLAGAAVTAGVLAFLAPLTGGALGPGVAGILALPGTLLGLSMAFLWLHGNVRRVVIPVFLLGMSAAALTFASWSTGFDEADAGVPPSLLGTMFVPAGIVAAVLLAAAAAIVVAATLRLRPIPRTLIAATVGLLSVPFVGPLIVSGPAVTVAALAMMLMLMLRSRGQVRAAKPRASAGVGVRSLALVSFLMTVAALSYGLVAGIALAGTDAASQAMGVMAAGGNLAAIPLMAAATQLMVPRRVAPRIGLIVGGFGVAVGCVGWASGFDLSGGGFLAIPLFVGLWAATVTGCLIPGTGGARVGISVLVGLGVAVAYFMLVLTLAGAALALASGFLAFGGLRLLTKTKEMGVEATV